MNTYKKWRRALTLCALILLASLAVSGSLFAGVTPPSAVESQKAADDAREAAVRAAEKAAAEAQEAALKATKKIEVKTESAAEKAKTEAAKVVEEAKKAAQEAAEKAQEGVEKAQEAGVHVVDKAKVIIIDSSKAIKDEGENTATEIKDAVEKATGDQIETTETIVTTGETTKVKNAPVYKVETLPMVRTQDQDILSARVRPIEGLYLRVGYPAELGYRTNDIFVGLHSNYLSLGGAISYHGLKRYINIGDNISPLILSVGPHLTAGTTLSDKSFYVMPTVQGRIAYQLPIRSNVISLIEFDAALDLGVLVNLSKNEASKKIVAKPRFGGGLSIGATFQF